MAVEIRMKRWKSKILTRKTRNSFFVDNPFFNLWFCNVQMQKISELMTKNIEKGLE